MKCLQVQELLSAYVDEELPAGERSAVAEHVASCARCGEELVMIERMSTLAGALDTPRPPEGLWAGIEAALDEEQSPLVNGKRRDAGAVAEQLRRRVRRRQAGILAAAAVLLLALGGAWLTATFWPDSGRDAEMAVDFNQYLQSFHHDPENAQRLLLAGYGGRAVDVAEATRQLGYRPKVAAGLPEGYSLEALHLLEMPCCKCLNALCRRDDGKLFVIFEHGAEQPVSFGQRPRVETRCSGCPCSVIGADQGLVASWKSDKRQLTVVGDAELNEMTDLIGHLQRGTPDT